MLVQERPAGAEEIVAGIRDGLLQAIEAGTPLSLAHEAQVHRAIDLLRGRCDDPEMLGRIEHLSCIMRPMPAYLRQGRVNAYASAVARLRRTACSL